MRTTIFAALAAAAIPLAGCATTTTPTPAAPTVVSQTRVEPGGVYEIVHNPADGDLYIAAVGPRGANQARIVRIDANTGAPVSTVDVSANALYGLGFNSRTQTLYGTATLRGVVSAIDVRTGAVLANIAAPGATEENHAHLREVVVDEAANRAYASAVGFTREGVVTPSQIWVIDGATNTLARTINVETDTLTGIALDAAGNRIFGTGMGSNDVAVVDLATGATTARWPTQSERPTNLVYDAVGNRLFVASQGTGDLTVLDARTGAIISKVATGEGALSVAHNPALNQVYVANRQAGTVTVINAADYTVVAQVDAGTLPQSIAIDRRTNVVYVTNKARGVPRGSPPGTPAPEDPHGDTLTVIRVS